MKRALVVICLVIGFAAYSNAQCTQSAAISVSAGSTGELVASLGGRQISVCGYQITGNTAATGAQFQYGTGTTCGTGTTNLTGVFLMGTYGGLSLTASGNNGRLFTIPGLNSICLAATTGAVTGVLNYEQ